MVAKAIVVNRPEGIDRWRGARSILQLSEIVVSMIV
jgi:hypothetical protein